MNYFGFNKPLADPSKHESIAKKARQYCWLRWDFTFARPVSPNKKGTFSVWQRAIKRAEDVAIAGPLLLLAAPVMVAIAILVKCDSRGPALFRQPRIGRHDKVFEILKFRTMHVEFSDLGAHQQTCRGDRRVTRIGAMLRRSSLDELPQLLNVLGGSMALVGPRPHALHTTADGVPLEKAVPAYPLRHSVKPGITGLAQVNGSRGELSTTEKLARRVAYDLEYVESWSLSLDLRILWRTGRTLLIDPNAY